MTPVLGRPEERQTAVWIGGSDLLCSLVQLLGRLTCRDLYNKDTENSYA